MTPMTSYLPYIKMRPDSSFSSVEATLGVLLESVYSPSCIPYVSCPVPCSCDFPFALCGCADTDDVTATWKNKREYVGLDLDFHAESDCQAGEVFEPLPNLLYLLSISILLLVCVNHVVLEAYEDLLYGLLQRFHLHSGFICFFFTPQPLYSFAMPSISTVITDPNPSL